MKIFLFSFLCFLIISASLFAETRRAPNATQLSHEEKDRSCVDERIYRDLAFWGIERDINRWQPWSLVPDDEWPSYYRVCLSSSQHVHRFSFFVRIEKPEYRFSLQAQATELYAVPVWSWSQAPACKDFLEGQHDVLCSRAIVSKSRERVYSYWFASQIRGFQIHHEDGLLSTIALSEDGRPVWYAMSGKRRSAFVVLNDGKMVFGAATQKDSRPIQSLYFWTEDRDRYLVITQSKDDAGWKTTSRSYHNIDYSYELSKFLSKNSLLYSLYLSPNNVINDAKNIKRESIFPRKKLKRIELFPLKDLDSK